MGNKRSQSVLKESYIDSVLNENPSAAVISLQAKRHSSLGFNEAFEKGDFFLKDGESSVGTALKPKLSFKGSKIDLEQKSEKPKLKKKPSLASISPNRFEDSEKASASIPSQAVEEWLDATLRQDEEEKAADRKEGNSDQVPLEFMALGKYRPTLKYGLDSTALINGGLSSDLALRL